MNMGRAQFLTEKGSETLIAVHVQPKAAKNELAGVFQDRLKIRVCAPPVEGEANKRVIIFLAELLGIAKNEISLVKGGQSRQKVFLVSRPIDYVSERFLEAGI